MIINMQSGGVVPERIIDAQTIMPGTADKVISAGTYLRGNLTITGDADLAAENIKYGVNLFGVDGNMLPHYGANVWKRGYYTPAKNFTAKFVRIDELKVRLQITGAETNEITPAMLVGKTIGSSKYYDQSYIEVRITSTTQCYMADYYNDITKYIDYTYDGNTGVLTLAIGAFYTGENITWTWKSFNGTIPEVFDVTDFVVNDDSTAYPNGALHTDGYYYELLGQVSSANVMSLSDNALMTVQQDYRDTVETEVSNANA